MMNYRTMCRLAVSVMACLFVAGCPAAAPTGGATSIGGSDVVGANGPDVSVTADAGTAPPTGAGKYPSKDSVPKATGGTWTVLLYSMADTNLEDPMMDDVLEMTQVGSTAQLNLVVQIDRAEGHTDKRLGPVANFTSTKRFKVVKGGFEELADLGEKDRTKPSELADFVAWGIKTFPADRYALILSDHGGGYVGMGPDDSNGTSDLLDLTEMRDGLAAGLAQAGVERLDLIGFDACLMANIETALAVRPFAHLMLASEELEPGQGWDYRTLQVLADTPSTTGLQLGQTLLTGYVAHAKEYNTESTITLSLVDLNELEPLADALDALAQAGVGKLNTAGLALGKARGKARQFGGEHKDDTGMVDLGQLAELAAKQAPELQAAASAVEQALKGAVVAMHLGPTQVGATGLSVYFPGSAEGYQKSYEILDFMAGWRFFLGNLFGWAKQTAAVSKPEFAAAANPIVDQGDKLVISGQLATGDGQYVADSQLLVGEVDSANQSLLAFLVLPAQVAGDKVSGSWSKEVGVLVQGSKSLPGFSNVAVDGGFIVIDMQVLYTPAGSGPLAAQLRFVLDSTGSPADVPVLYVANGGVIGAVEPGPGDLLEPMVLMIGKDDVQQWKPIGQSVAADGQLDFGTVAYSGEGPIMMYLHVEDLAGQQTALNGLWSPAAVAPGPCGNVTDVGCCTGDVLHYCDSGTPKSQDCGASGLACGWSSSAGYYDCTATSAADPSGTHPLQCTP